MSAMKIEELAGRVHFAFESAEIWWDEERMLLLHSSSFRSLQQQLLEMLGWDRARSVLTRMGFASGKRDAEILRQRYPDLSDLELLRTGPMMRSIQGIAKVIENKLELDIARGHYYADVQMENSIGRFVQAQDYSGNWRPTMWIETGHASGFVTQLLGRFVLHKEFEYDGKSSRVVGKPLEDWKGAADDELSYYEADSVVEEILTLRSQVFELQQAASKRVAPTDLIGRSPAFVAAWSLAERAARSKATVLLLGETGVGKEMFACAIHQASGRSAGSFVALNCGALPSELLESELFGVEKGAFTGAQQSRPGRFERADGGTLFLDEVGEMSMSAQTRLLRVLQDGAIDRLGSTSTRKVDVRLIAATNVDLEQAVESGKFRKDLFYRLNVYPIKIPPLRERRGDIPLLTDRFITRIGAREGRRVRGLTDRARHAMLAHDWPGNVRELENAIERALILTDDDALIEASALFAGVLPSAVALEPDSPIGKRGQITREGTAADSVDLFLDHVLNERITLDSVEAVLMEAAVKRAQGNLSEAARLLGLSRGQLAYRMKKREEQD